MSHAAEATAVTPELEAAAERAESRRGFLLALPGYVYLLILFVLPMVIMFVYSFASRTDTGRTLLQDWNLGSYRGLFDGIVLRIMWRSLWLALACTVISLLLAYPFAFFIATRSARLRNILLVLVMVPFWTNFLVRTYAWRVILGSKGPFSALAQLVGLGETRLLFSDWAILIGLVYGFLPFAVLPLYAAIERIDWSLVEAGRDLYASGWQAFRRITLPLSMPGIIAATVLVFIPSFGAYVTPEILGGANTVMLGSYISKQFLEVGHWPFGSALSFVIMAVMLIGTVVYFRTGAKTL